MVAPEKPHTNNLPLFIVHDYNMALDQTRQWFRSSGVFYFLKLPIDQERVDVISGSFQQVIHGVNDLRANECCSKWECMATMMTSPLWCPINTERHDQQQKENIKMIAQAQPKYLIPSSRSKQDPGPPLSCSNLAKHSTEAGLEQERG